jgi:methyl-accepting chemotaxis protein
MSELMQNPGRFPLLGQPLPDLPQLRTRDSPKRTREVEMPRWFRRRVWLIDTKVQVRLGLRIVTYLVAYLLLFFAMSVGERFLALQGSLPRAEAWADAWREAATVGGRLALPLLLALGCMLLHGILLLHRLAGPAYRMRLALSRLSEGDLTDIVCLRDGDHLEDLAALYNQGVGRIREDVGETRRRAVELLESLRDEEERQRVDDLLAALARYRTGDDEPELEGPEQEVEEAPAEETTPTAEA